MRSLLLSAVLLAPFLVAGQTPSKREIKVRRQLAHNKVYPAIRNATAMLIKGGHPEFHALRAEGYNNIAEHGKAEADARESLRLLPGNPDGLYQLALAEQGAGRWDSAAFHLRELLRQAPGVDTRYRLAMVEQARGRLDEAMAEIGRAIAESGPPGPDAARLHRVKGEIAAMAGDTALARAELDQAIELAPSDPVNYNSRGYYLHAWRGDHRAAVQEYDRAIKLNPNYSYAFNNRGWSLYQLGETAQGLKDIERARRRKVRNPYVYRNLGMIALGSGDTAKACMLLRQALDNGFTVLYGHEVENTIAASCGRLPVPVQPPSRTPAPRPADGTMPRSNAPE